MKDPETQFQILVDNQRLLFRWIKGIALLQIVILIGLWREFGWGLFNW